jgi:ubiquinone/menaquinone biosynthesis C-methylase UbiE
VSDPERRREWVSRRIARLDDVEPGRGVSGGAVTWSRLRYDVIAPFYDLGPAFDEERGTAFHRLALRDGESVLVVGVGTGADLPFLPSAVHGVAIDLSPAMLEQARARARTGIELLPMDGHALEFAPESFDAVVLHQVLEVVRDPGLCLAEAARVLKVGGRISVFDKFLPPGFRPPLWHRVATQAIDVVFTTANRSFEEILDRSGAPLAIELDSPFPPPSPFRHLLLRKPDLAFLGELREAASENLESAVSPG